MSGEEKPMARNVRIERAYPDQLQSHFVSNVVVQHQPEHFVLSFFEIWPPAIIGETDAEKKQALEAVDHVEAKCVARLVLTPSTMREFIDAATENLQSYEKMMQMRLELGDDA